MTAPPSATINPAALLNPVSRARAAPIALLLLVFTPVVLAVASEVFAPAVLVTLPVPLVLVTGQALVHGIALVKGNELASLAEAKTGAWDAIAGLG